MRIPSPGPGALLLAGALLACALPAVPARATVIQSARVVRLIDGREVFINGRTARPNDTARAGQQLRTGRSRAELLFDGRTVGFMGRSSVLNVGSQCLRLDRGAVLMSGPQKTCLGTKVLGVRATTTILQREVEGYNVITLEGVAYVGDEDGYEEQRRNRPGAEAGGAPATQAPPSATQTPPAQVTGTGSIPVVDGDPSGRTTYICRCEVAQFNLNGEFQRQAVLSRSQLVAALNRFTDDKLQLPPGVAERIQESIAQCK